MSEYTLRFEAKFGDGDIETITKVASILTEAKAEILRTENDQLRARLAEAEADAERLVAALRLVDDYHKRDRTEFPRRYPDLMLLPTNTAIYQTVWGVVGKAIADHETRMRSDT